MYTDLITGLFFGMIIGAAITGIVITYIRYKRDMKNTARYLKDDRHEMPIDLTNPHNRVKK